MSPPSAIDIEAVEDTEAIVLTDPLTVNGVPARRAKAGKLVAGTAAYTTSNFFKSLVSFLPLDQQPQANFSRLLGNQKPNDGTVGSARTL